MPKKKEPCKQWEVRTDRMIEPAADGRPLTETFCGGGFDEFLLRGKGGGSWLHIEQMDVRNYCLILYGNAGRNVLRIALDKQGMVKSVYVQEEDFTKRK